MATRKFICGGRRYFATFVGTVLGVDYWSFSGTYHDHVITEMHSVDFNPVTEFDECAISWSQFIDQLFLDSGAIVHDDEHGYTEPNTLTRLNREARWTAEHNRSYTHTKASQL